MWSRQWTWKDGAKLTPCWTMFTAVSRGVGREPFEDPAGRLRVSRDVPALPAGNGLASTQRFLGLQKINADMTKQYF